MIYCNCLSVRASGNELVLVFSWLCIGSCLSESNVRVHEPVPVWSEWSGIYSRPLVCTHILVFQACFFHKIYSYQKNFKYFTIWIFLNSLNLFVVKRYATKYTVFIKSFKAIYKPGVEKINDFRFENYQ